MSGVKGLVGVVVDVYVVVCACCSESACLRRSVAPTFQS